MDKPFILRKAAKLLHDDIKCLRAVLHRAIADENKILIEEIQQRSTTAKNLLDMANEIDNKVIRNWGKGTAEQLAKIPNAYRGYQSGKEGRGGRAD